MSIGVQVGIAAESIIANFLAATEERLQLKPNSQNAVESGKRRSEQLRVAARPEFSADKYNAVSSGS